MLPTKVFQLDYQDFGDIVWSHFDMIHQFQQDQNCLFDVVVAKLRNGTIPGSIIATNLNLPMGVMEMARNTEVANYKVFFPTLVEEKILRNEQVNVLFVDSICGTGITVNSVKEFFAEHFHYKKINVKTYCTIVDVKAKHKPDLVGFVQEKYIQPPWEWSSFTPQNHLARLEENTIKTDDEDFSCLGFSSKLCKSIFEQAVGYKCDFEWMKIFDVDKRKIATTSGISFVDIPELSISMEEAKTKYKKLIEAKVDFIKDNGLTHFIENDLVQALMVASETPVCHIIFTDGQSTYRIYGKSINKNYLLTLKF